MLRLLRLVLACLSVVLLLAGYFASQLASMQGNFAAYAEKVDSAPIRVLALFMLLAAIASGILGERGSGL